MAKQSFADVFAAHPEATQIFEVNGMPFLKKSDAENFKRGTEYEIKVVARPTAKTEASPKMTKEEIKEKLTGLGVDFDAKANKAELEKLLLASAQEEE